MNNQNNYAYDIEKHLVNLEEIHMWSLLDLLLYAVEQLYEVDFFQRPLFEQELP